MRIPLLSMLLLFLLALECPAPGLHVFAVGFAERGRTWERFETVGNVWGDFTNPFDPAGIALRGEFRAPDGTVHTIPGFWTQEYERALVGGFERLTERDPPHWAVRFSPTEPGTWAWRWVATSPTETAATGWNELPVDPPAADAHGFLRPSPDDPQYLRFDDGTPYLAIGENLAWYDGRGTFAYDDWLAKLAAQGVNYIRLWMPSWAFGIEWGGPLGDYSNRLDRAWQLDYVLEAAERHGIYVMLCIQNHGPFSLTANSEWASNPYNSANGGPLADPTELFTNAEARELFRRRLRYIVARWGYSTHVLAWELWNEVNLVALGPDVDAWHTEMAGELDRLDPYDHLVTTSFSSIPVASLWELPAIDFVQLHYYAFPLALDMPTIIDTVMGAQATAYPDKPRLLSEYGVDYRGPGETRQNDPEAVGFHQGLWAGLLAGGFGTGMTWWWDNLIDPDDLYFHFGPLAAFTEGIAFDRAGFERARPVASAPGRNLAAYALQGPETVLVWLQNADHQWFPPGGAGVDLVPVEDATLALTGLADGDWRARWIDTYTGADVSFEAIEVGGGAVDLAVPSFSRDVALRLER